MKNVLKIFFSDLRAIFGNFFAVVIVGAVLVIPALYAWVNIYANWDPYGSTGNVPIALASSDLGYTQDDGSYVNRGQEIIEGLPQSKSIRWILCPSAQDAIAGVERGDYYGALVMGENLSRNMYELTLALYDQEPSIVFYQNAKTNAIANKITTTAATTAEHNIQVKYLSVLIERLFGSLDQLLEEVDGESALDNLIHTLSRLRDHLYEYDAMLQKLRDSEPGILAKLDETGYSLNGVDLSGAADKTGSASVAISSVEKSVQDRLDTISADIARLQATLQNADERQVTSDMVDRFLEQAEAIETSLQALRSTLPADGLLSGAVVNTTDTLLQRIQSIETQLPALRNSESSREAVRSMLDASAAALGEMNSILTENLTPGFEHFFGSMARDLEILSRILGGVDRTVRDVQPVLSAAKSTIVAANGTLAQLQALMQSAARLTDKLLNKAVAARDSDMLQDLIELLHGDPEEFAEFFSNPVLVETYTVYPVENYGTAMTPFYSTLAIWVGCVVIGAIIKTEAGGERLKNPTEGQLFWGRFLIYLLFSQIQAAIIVAGDIWLLGCQCLHPGLFFLVGAVTSFVFVLLIYALCLSFGDVGKAIVVVIMVVQIAGSSGSYPIEILPPIFSHIYLFFPFPYAINAMRETLCGLYRLDLLRYLAQLMIFGVLGMLIGLVVRRPFIGVNRFIEEEMEETGVL